MPLPSAGTNSRRVERVRLEAGRRDEEDQDRRERARGVRRELACVLARRPDRDRRVAGEDQRPEEHRARLAAPERREHVHLRHVRAGVPATYLSEKSCVSSAVQSPIDASITIANVAYSPRRPLA